MDAYELFVCGQYLTSYPDHLSFDDVIELLHSLDEEVLVWAPFENLSADDLTESMWNTVKTLRDEFVPRRAGA